MAKKSNKLSKGESNYLYSVLNSILKFGFKKKDIIKVLKRI